MYSRPEDSLWKVPKDELGAVTALKACIGKLTNIERKYRLSSLHVEFVKKK